MAGRIKERDNRSRTVSLIGRLTISGAVLATLAACDPATGRSIFVPESVNQADYERHKANRESYLYQGF